MKKKRVSEASTLEDPIDDAIRDWAEQYNDQHLAKMMGDAVMAYRLRGELQRAILRVIEKTSKKVTPRN